MPLLDHFHPPLSERRHWESFHGTWAHEIMARLNRVILPQGYFAEATLHVGSQVEVDVGSFEEVGVAQASGSQNGGVLVETYSPPAAAATMPAVFSDQIEVQVFRASGGATLVGALEFVSPANKDRPETRRVFAAKCASYLSMGIGLAVVDVVTDRQGNLHNELIELLQQDDEFRFVGDSRLYAVAYRPRRREPDQDQIEMWFESLILGKNLPTLPLALRGGPIVPLELELTYVEAQSRTRL